MNTRRITRKQAETTAVILASGAIGGAVGAGIAVTTNLFIAPAKPTPGQARFGSQDAKQRTAILRAACELQAEEKKVRRALAKVAKAEEKGKEDKVIKFQADLKIAWMKYLKTITSFDAAKDSYDLRIEDFSVDSGLDTVIDELLVEDIVAVVTEALSEPVEVAAQPLTEPEVDAKALLEENLRAAGVEPLEPTMAHTPQVAEVLAPMKSAVPNPVTVHAQAKPLSVEPISKRQQKRIASRERAQRLEAERQDAEQIAKEAAAAAERLSAESAAIADAKQAAAYQTMLDGAASAVKVEVKGVGQPA